MRRNWDDTDALSGLMGGMNLAPSNNKMHHQQLGNGWQQQQPITHQAALNHYANAPVMLSSAGYVQTTPFPADMGGYITMAPPPNLNLNLDIGGGAPPHSLLYSPPPPIIAPNPQSMGWGGQAISDPSGFKAPWFGKTRGGKINNTGHTRGGQRDHRNNNDNGNNNGNNHHNSNSNGYRSRSQNYNGNYNQRNGGSRHRNNGWNGNYDSSRSGSGSGSPGTDDSDEFSIDTVVQNVASLPRGTPVPDSIYQALFRLEGRSCALLLKELSKAGLARRAGEIFDWLRRLEQGHPLRTLLDVFSYTASISLCIPEHNVERALALASEMKMAGVERNVHTYTALMNVCIKCAKHQMALETYRLMRADGCQPNVVTYNTLIDVYGKTGMWEEAVAVLPIMKSEGVEPVLRTYNTLIIACNMCNQPREAIAIHRKMLQEGHSPNSTTYNALISAYGKAGQLEMVMDVFQEMLYRGCERSVITYSSLISACEKAGQWELAMELFKEMMREQCAPNTVTYNSLITALAQGAQWERANEVFEQMPAQGCNPDVVTYTALISAFEKGGQWRLALSAFGRMKAQGCMGDAIVYNAVIDALWETGVIWAQRKALEMFRGAVDEGHFLQGRLVPGLARAEVNLHAMTAGVAMLSLYAWLISLKQLVLRYGPSAAPLRVAIVTDRGKGAKEQGNLVVKEAVAAVMSTWGSPLKSIVNSSYSGMLEATGADMAAWLMSGAFEARLFAFFPCTDILPSVANSRDATAAAAAMGVAIHLDDDPCGTKETTMEARCSEAFAAVRHFEKTHCLALQNMSYSYLQRRNELVSQALDVAIKLGATEEVAHDAVLLMDRVMSTSLDLQPDLMDLLALACVAITVRQSSEQLSSSASSSVITSVGGSSSSSSGNDGGGRSGSSNSSTGSDGNINNNQNNSTSNSPPTEILTSARLEAAAGFPAAAIERMEWNIHQVLSQDTSAISTLRCMELYLERLGGTHVVIDGDTAAATAMGGRAKQLSRDALRDMAFLNCRPSVIAAALLYVERRSRGAIPFWPSMLAKLTGYQDMSTPELSVAIRAAQRVGTTVTVHTTGGGGGASSTVPAGGGGGGDSNTFSATVSPAGLFSLGAMSPKMSTLSMNEANSSSLNDSASDTASIATASTHTTNHSDNSNGISHNHHNNRHHHHHHNGTADNASLQQTLMVLKQAVNGNGNGNNIVGAPTNLLDRSSNNAGNGNGNTGADGVFHHEQSSQLFCNGTGSGSD